MTKSQSTGKPLPIGPPEALAKVIIEIANKPNLSHGNQRLVRRWLDGLVHKIRSEPAPSAAARRRVLQDIKDAFSEVELRDITKSAIIRDCKISLDFHFDLRADTFRAEMGYYFATVINDGYDKFIRFCPECGRFFFDKPSGRPIKWFCTPAHNNAYRQREYREKQK